MKAVAFSGVTSAAIVVLGFATALACGGDDAASTSSGGASSGGASSGGASSGGASSSGASSSGASSTSSGGGSSSGGPVAADEGLVPDGSVWRARSEWFRPVDTAPVAEISSEMVGAIKTWGQTDVFQIDFAFNVLDGAGGTPTTFPPDDEADAVPVPIPAKGYIEGDNAYDGCPGGEDCHLLVFDRPASRLYEVYQAHKAGAAWTGSVTMWKLDRAYPRTNRGAGCTSADAAGLPIAPGLVGYRETKKGTIAHALRFILRNDYIRGVAGDRNVPNVVYPASHGTTAGASASGVPYGARLRLKASFSDADPRLKSPGAKALAKALKTYGMILADGGNLPIVAESVKVHADANPAETWDGLLAPRDLSFLRPSDFEVVAIPKGDPSQPAAGWYQTKAEYVAQLQKPLGCAGVVQP
jgi:serine/threonine-protein kinase